MGPEWNFLDKFYHLGQLGPSGHFVPLHTIYHLRTFYASQIFFVSLDNLWFNIDEYPMNSYGVILSESSHLVSGKKMKNDLRVMKQILYDMGPLTLVRWLLQRALKFEPPFGPRSRPQWTCIKSQPISVCV